MPIYAEKICDMRTLLKYAIVAQPAGPVGTPPKLGSQENSWLRC